MRDLLAKDTVALPGVFNALTAMLVEQTGFQAVYVSGAGLSNSAGLPDEGLLTLTEFVEQARHIARAVTTPVICDADTGFGEAINVLRTVREFESAGVAGIQIEDQELPKRCGHLDGKRVVEADAMVEKIRAALKGRSDPDFMLIARTDARHVTGMEDAIRRARLYAEAGADAVFPEALETAEEFSLFVREVSPSFGKRLPVFAANMTEFGKTPLLSVTRLHDLGYRMVIFPQTMLRVALQAMKKTLETLKRDGTQEQLIERMMSRSDLYRLIRYDVYREIDEQLKPGRH